jgi:transposase InsO family protein
VDESFFSTLRAESTDLERFPSRQVTRSTVFEFYQVYFNRHRLHLSLGYHSPMAFETARLS